MPLSLDHVVIAVADLDAAIRNYEALGFTVVPGGEHAGGVTHNALVVFADGTYLELIAFRRPDPDSRWWRLHDRVGDGLVDYALLPDDVGATVGSANARGLDLEGPYDGGRARPDGAVLRWQTARSPRSDVPFLCGDLTPRSLRVPEGPARHHANGVSGIAEVAVAVRDRAVSARRYEALLADDDAANAERSAFTLGRAVLRIEVRESDVQAAYAIEARDEGPYAVRFRSSGPTAELDPARTHGARLRVGAA
ncbi:VOC family protein [Methylobacterium brachiatum]|uniref:VOC family protein n=1 Tax=Methylobacterium brachiatum TaxID=269660 RepID=UPI0024483C63|nr:VOC family protein [Methylobacterium brachiatum]MDH2313612.1 VOC family protein [Methylobacterium brachiatum]